MLAVERTAPRGVIVRGRVAGVVAAYVPHAVVGVQSEARAVVRV